MADIYISQSPSVFIVDYSPLADEDSVRVDSSPEAQLDKTYPATSLLWMELHAISKRSLVLPNDTLPSSQPYHNYQINTVHEDAAGKVAVFHTWYVCPHYFRLVSPICQPSRCSYHYRICSDSNTTPIPIPVPILHQYQYQCQYYINTNTSTNTTSIPIPVPILHQYQYQ